MVEELQRDGGPPDERRLRSLVLDVLGPPGPGVDGRPHESFRLAHLPRRPSIPVEQQGDPIAGAEVEGRARAAERGGREQVEIQVRAGRVVQAQTFPLRLGPDAAARLDRDPEPDRPLHDLDETQELPARGPGVLAEIGARPERQGIGQPHERGTRPELGDEDAGVALVELPRGLEPLGGDRERSAARGIEERTEERRRVEPRHAKPRDGPVAANERSRRAVADEAVILDRKAAVQALQRGEGVHRRGARRLFASCHEANLHMKRADKPTAPAAVVGNVSSVGISGRPDDGPTGWTDEASST